MPAPNPSDRTACAALEQLAAYLGPRDYATVLLSGDDCATCLTVTSRPTRLSIDVYVHEGWYCSVPPAQIARITNPAAAARHIAATLGGTTAATLTR